MFNTDMLTNVSKTLADSLAELKFNLIKASPDIKFWGGLACVGVGTGMACAASTNLNDTMVKAKGRIEYVKALDKEGVYETEKEYNTELTKAYAKSAGDLVKLYIGPAIVELTGIALLTSSHIELKDRNASLAAAYAALDRGYKAYRKNVIDAEGEDADRKYRLGIKKENIEEEIVDEKTGKTKKVKKKVDVVDMDDPNTYSPFARFFDDMSRNWERDSEANLAFLTLCQHRCDQLLKTRHYLFLNEVYDMLDIPMTKLGQTVGWYYSEGEDWHGDNYVDFGITEVRRRSVREFRNGYEKSILLDFNIDGDIMSKLKEDDVPRYFIDPETHIVHEV